MQSFHQERALIKTELKEAKHEQDLIKKKLKEAKHEQDLIKKKLKEEKHELQRRKRSFRKELKAISNNHQKAIIALTDDHHKNFYHQIKVTGTVEKDAFLTEIESIRNDHENKFLISLTDKMATTTSAAEKAIDDVCQKGTEMIKKTI